MTLGSIPRLATILAIAALPACAADSATTSDANRPAQVAAGPGPDHGMHRHHGRHGHGGDGRLGMMAPERIEGRLAFLKTELKITEVQAPQWNAVADYLRERAKAAQAQHAAMRERHQQHAAGQRPAPRPLTERLGEAEKRMEQRLAEMRRFKATVEPLYAVMSEGQRKSADQLLGRG
jgi:hypothetical protein